MTNSCFRVRNRRSFTSSYRVSALDIHNVGDCPYLTIQLLDQVAGAIHIIPDDRCELLDASGFAFL